MIITIFKTSVQDEKDLGSIRPIFNSLLGKGRWSFAFEDVDKILRVVSLVACKDLIEQVLRENGFLCEELPYSLD